MHRRYPPVFSKDAKERRASKLHYYTAARGHILLAFFEFELGASQNKISVESQPEEDKCAININAKRSHNEG